MAPALCFPSIRGSMQTSYIHWPCQPLYAGSCEDSEYVDANPSWRPPLAMCRSCTIEIFYPTYQVVPM